MDVREKLVELFYDNNVRCDQKIEGLADDVMDIIANRVAVQEWISVNDRLPEKEGEYITYTDKGEIHFDCFCIYPNHGTKFWVGGNGKVTHWMPLTQPPKGE